MNAHAAQGTVSVVLPSLNPTQILSDTVDGLLAAGFSHIVLVDDGSRAEAQRYFDSVSRHPEVTLLRHETNRGKGAAMKTAFAWLLEHRPDCSGVVTVDGDGQHHPEDALSCARQMLERGQVVLGCRDFSQPDVPPRSRMGNRITCAVFRVFCGMKLSDTQTGLRAIPARYLPALTAVSGDRYEYETNMLLALKDQAIPYGEASIRTIYLEENRGSHFHVFRDSWKIYRLILAHFFRYAVSSVVSAVADSGLFALLSVLLAAFLTGTLLNAAATVGARIISSLLNFAMNRSLVFRSAGPLGRALARYYALALPVLAAQFLLTEGLFRLLHVGDGQTLLRTVIYTAVMVALFVGSYVIQHRWVFAAEKKEIQKGSS